MVVRDAVENIKKELLEILRGELRMKRRMKALKEECKTLRDEKLNREKEKKRGKKRRRRVMAEESSTENDVMDKREVRGQRRTYAEATGKGKKQDKAKPRIEGRVWVTGDEGWQTPPSTRRVEGAVVVASKEENSARKLAEELAKSVSAKEIGEREYRYSSRARRLQNFDEKRKSRARLRTVLCRGVLGAGHVLQVLQVRTHDKILQGKGHLLQMCRDAPRGDM